MKQHYFDVPFAFAGDVTAIPDPLQVGGTVSMTEGWNNNYQRNLSTDPAALPIDRSTTNWLLLQISTAIQALQQASVPEFILASQNGGAAYSYGKGASVLWSASGNAPFVKYVSLTAGNTNTPSASDPQGLTTGWQIEVDPISTAAQASAGTDDASIMTPLKVAQQTALRALLAGSSSQVFNVANGVAPTHAVNLAQLQAAQAGELLRVSVYRIVSSIQQVSINGGAFTSAGATTFTSLSNTTKVIGEVLGGGGAGSPTVNPAGGQNSIGGGGGGGAYAIGLLTSGFSGGITVTVGAGGTSGTSGTASSIGALISANGGVNGSTTNNGSAINFSAAGGAGGTVTVGGNIRTAAGSQGANGLSLNGPLFGGTGGAAGNGGGGANGVGSGSAGQAAVSFGGGGGGACVTSGGGSQLGGKGGDGQVVIYEYA